ncbi:MAG TPA: aspartyl protease family protein [Pyrinomonadaceae bacterium]|nr:aspartyl protease family protein [Pyrinomonadaceae bacterium]
MNTEVKFRLAGGAQPLILVPASVNESEPHEFILDTGAGISLLTPELAERFGVAATDSKEAMGVGGKVTISLGVARLLEVGESRVENIQVAITDELHRIGAVIGARVEGNIGYNFLKEFSLTIDYQSSTLSLTRVSKEASGAGAAAAGMRATATAARAELKFKLAHPSKPLILLPVFIDGGGPYIFATDTGASSTVVSPELAEMLGIHRTDIPEVTGAGGAMQASTGVLRSLGVGDALVENLPVVIVPSLGMISQAVGTKLDGIIGYNFLKEFRVTIDYPNETLRLD